MRITELTLLALASKLAYGYLDTSPFFMFSTSEYASIPNFVNFSVPNSYHRLLLPTDQIQSGSKLTSDLKSTLSSCPSDFYLLIKQPGISISDFSSPASAPTLSKFSNHATHSTLRSSLIIAEVVGDIGMNSLEQELKSKCGAWSTAVDPLCK